MRKQSDQMETLCKKCNRFINTNHFLIHKARCNGQSKISLSSLRIPTQTHEEQLQLIPCSFCSYPQTLKQLDTHPNQCPHREAECERCHETFPMSLLEQHETVCPRRRRNEQRNSYEEEGERMPSSIFGPQMMLLNFFRRASEETRPTRPPRHQISQFEDPERRFVRMRNFPQLFTLIELLAGREGQSSSKGLRKSEIQEMPVTKYKAKEEAEMCTVCYCEFEQNQNVMILPCKHLFHPDCVGKWLQKNDLCPVCKQSCKKKVSEQRRRSSSPFYY